MVTHLNLIIQIKEFVQIGQQKSMRIAAALIMKMQYELKNIPMVIYNGYFRIMKI